MRKKSQKSAWRIPRHAVAQSLESRMLLSTGLTAQYFSSDTGNGLTGYLPSLSGVAANVNFSSGANTFPSGSSTNFFGQIRRTHQTHVDRHVHVLCRCRGRCASVPRPNPHRIGRDQPGTHQRLDESQHGRYQPHSQSHLGHKLRYQGGIHQLHRHGLCRDPSGRQRLRVWPRHRSLLLFSPRWMRLKAPTLQQLSTLRRILPSPSLARRAGRTWIWAQRAKSTRQA